MNFMECFSCDSKYLYAICDYTQFMLSGKTPYKQTTTYGQNKFSIENSFQNVWPLLSIGNF